MDEQKKAELIRLAAGARTEIEAYHGLLKRAGVHLFRAGRCLFEAKNLIRNTGITWAEWLRQEGIADSTTRQAIDLFRNAKAQGHDEIDLEGLSITEAKISYGVVAPKPRKDKAAVSAPTPPVLPNPRPSEGEAASASDPENPEAREAHVARLPGIRGRSSQSLGKGDRPREAILRELDSIYGDEKEELQISLSLSTWKLLDFLAVQEEVDQQGVIVTRAVQDYWLRHGDPSVVGSRDSASESAFAVTGAQS
jgi:hypothetical protein